MAGALAGELVRAHGKLSLVGYHQGLARAVDIGMWNWKAIDVVNAHVRETPLLVAAIRKGLALVASGRLSLEPLVTHRFGLEETDRAFELLETKPHGFIKAVVVMDGVE